MHDAQTREREIRALCEACGEFGLQNGVIVTGDHEEEINQEGYTFHCIPFWKWAQKNP